MPFQMELRIDFVRIRGLFVFVYISDVIVQRVPERSATEIVQHSDQLRTSN